MDTKTNERVLRLLLQHKNAVNCVVNPVPLIRKHVSGLSDDEIVSSLYDLAGMELIVCGPATEDYFEVAINYKAFGYFREKREKKINEIKKWAWDTFKWVVSWSIPVTLGYFLGKH